MTAASLLPHAKPQPSDIRIRADVPDGMTFALCETPDDVARAAATPSFRDARGALIALTPEAAWQCLRDGRPYHKLEDFFDEQIFCALSEPMLDFQKRWLDRVDAALLESIPQFREVGFQPARMHAFFLKVVSDELFMCACALAHFFVTARPRRVFCFTDPVPRPVTWDLFFDESVYRLILQACARVYDVPLVCLPAGPGGRIRRPSVPAWLSARQKARLRSLRSLGLGGLVRRLSAPATAPLLVVNLGYDVSIVARSALARGWQCREVSEIAGMSDAAVHPSNRLVSALAASWPAIAADPSFRAPFHWFGADLWPAAEPRIHYWWHHVIARSWDAFTRARNQLMRRIPVAVIVWSPWGPIDEGVLHAGRVLGVPTVTYQHGGFEGSCDFIANDVTDMRAADYRFVYGAGVADYYRGRASLAGGTAQVIAVGSARLDALRPKPAAHHIRGLRRRCGAKQGESVVLYVPTMYMRHRRYMSCEDYGNVPYFELQARIVEIMRRFPAVRFVYKPFPKPRPDPIVEMIRSRCPNCRVVDNVPLPRLVWAADFHVIDIPSTGLLEALMTPKPILVLADKRYIRLRREARILLQKRVTLADTPDTFCERLCERLSDGRFDELAAPNREFLLAYGLHRDDGLSADRVIAALRDIIAVRPVQPTPLHAEVDGP